jgi:hypothetical protein
MSALPLLSADRLIAENHRREAIIGNGLPRFRALFWTTDIERFRAMAAFAAEEPASISKTSRPISAAVHFLLPMRTI